ncbi:hypothetical protein LOTGIDRAFT_238761 [Lottia gigantea]|uniref:Thyroglobulin type-1 domain-containing protein n=1 Tax=Lottia gigantea TaxID=225164 RepID=V4AXA0_LOTGI|nr:hypothetical protein LOTGIDRAFT_238761 [Lottia gigantea]ESO99685.1 hypothetical protein LOTGIDRAFT_238761 [Lottia gigantea]
MKVLLLIFAAAWGASEAIQCTPGICAAVSCVSALNCNGRVENNGGFCGCCPVCITQLAEKESCLQTAFIGIPNNAECGPGLTCDKSSFTCVKTQAKREDDFPSCADARKVFLDQKQNGGILLGAEEPKCDSDGTYSAVQCIGSQCHCTSAGGKNLGYPVNRGLTQGMDCKCARDQDTYAKTGLIGKLFYCGPNGNYRNYQCVGSVCWCKDSNGKQVGQSINIGLLSTLHCAA